MTTEKLTSKKDIIKFFDSEEKKVFTYSELEKIISKNFESWKLPSSMTVTKFIEYLCKNTTLKTTRFDFKVRPVIIYTWGPIPFYELSMYLKSNCYLSHYSATYIHQLTEQIPKTIYVNKEQDAKIINDTELEQSKIDWAFSRPTRMSQNIAVYKDKRICLLNGLYTNNTGVIKSFGPDGSRIKVTNIERTLIDITVRPEYSGGVFEVLKAFKIAKEKVSVNSLTAMLRKIDYKYPYHQAIGFYMELAGYSVAQSNLLSEFEMRYDFYLIHQIKEPEYSKRWRLFYPKGLG